VVGKQAGLPLPRKGKVKQASFIHRARPFKKKKSKQLLSTNKLKQTGYQIFFYCALKKASSRQFIYFLLRFSFLKG
jgi:hypothetical protein